MSNDFIQLPSGRMLYANNGILGINEELRPHTGYDDYMMMAQLDYDSSIEESIKEYDPYTTEDRIFIAELAISYWNNYKEALINGTNP